MYLLAQRRIFTSTRGRVTLFTLDLSASEPYQIANHKMDMSRQHTPTYQFIYINVSAFQKEEGASWIHHHHEAKLSLQNIYSDRERVNVYTRC